MVFSTKWQPGTISHGKSQTKCSATADKSGNPDILSKLLAIHEGNMSLALCEQQRRRSACTDPMRTTKVQICADLISTFVVRCLDSISLVSISEISSF